ncbi:hypothetical protein ES703_49685 [subsurface metagenome]
MENRTTPRLWIKEREKELKSLEEEIAALEGRIVETADCEEEIGFVEGLLRKRGGLYQTESGAKKLVEMKEELENKKIGLEKIKKELEAKVIEREDLRMYVRLAKREYETIT